MNYIDQTHIQFWYGSIHCESHRNHLKSILAVDMNDIVICRFGSTSTLDVIFLNMNTGAH